MNAAFRPWFSRLLLLQLCLLLGLPWAAAGGDEEHPLMRAVRRGDVNIVRSLLAQGTPCDLSTAQDVTPLMVAAHHRASRLVALLLDHGADPNRTNAYGSTALVWGAGDYRTLKLLLEAGAEPDVVTQQGNTPLLVAAAYPDSLRRIKLLARHGASLDVTNQRGLTAVFQAAAVGCHETVEFLLDHGCHPHPVRGSYSPLKVAANLGFESIVELLLARGADPGRATEPGRRLDHPPLLAALLGQRHGIARKLIEAGAAIHEGRLRGGVPALMLAAYVEDGETASARLLLEKGADPTVTNDRGETALTWALKRGDPELISLLRQAGTPEGVLKRKTLPRRSLADTDRRALMRQSIQEGINLLQGSSDAFLENRGQCVSCHHQNLPSMAMSWARDRGFQADAKALHRMIERQRDSWQRRVARTYEMNDPVPVPPRFLGWGLLGFHALGVVPDALTDAMSGYLASIQMPEGYWVSGTMRPPMGGNEILGTVLAMRSLQLYPVEGRRREFERRVRRARDWLARQKVRSHQDRVFKLLGLAWGGAETGETGPLVAALRRSQRDDGGWAQLPHLESDAWATGSALVALHLSGQVGSKDPVYQRGVRYLLQTRFDDGSWYVQSRSWPFQPHFDSRFPHGKDQWISAPATAWAVIALTLAVEPGPSGPVAARGPYFVGKEERPDPSGPASAGRNEGIRVTPGDFDFAGIIRPILARSCSGCHGGERPKGGFALLGRAALLKGGESGEPTVRPGQGAESLMVRVVSGQVEDMEMPPLAKREKYPALNREEIRQLSAWIDAGAPWPEGVKVE